MIALFFFFICCSLISQSQTYVATNGLDAFGRGTAAAPYKTIVFAVQQTAPGGTVLVAPGTYNETSDIYIAKPITIKRNGSTEVIVDGTNRGVSDFKNHVVIVNTSNVTIQGITFANNIGNGGKGIYALCTSAATANMNNILIKNCSVENIGWISNNLSAIPANSGIVTNAIKAEGRSATYAITNLKLINNNVENCATGWGEAVTITGNVNGFNVEGNFVFDIANIGIVAAGNYANTSTPDAVNRARNGLISGNEVHHCMSAIANSAGIYLDGAQNCRVEKNEVYSCGVGFAVGAEQRILNVANTPGGHIVNNNLIYKNVITGAYIGGSVSPFANLGYTTKIQNTQIFNNTFYQNRTGAIVNGVTRIGGVRVDSAADNNGGEVQLQSCDGVTFKNNILYAKNDKKALVALFGYNISNFVSNYNLYYRDVNLDFLISIGSITFNTGGTGAAYSPALFTATTGLDANTVTTNPEFVYVDTNDYFIKTNSPAKNKGDVVYNSTFSGVSDLDFKNRKRDGIVDIGCYEIQEGIKFAPALAGGMDDIQMNQEIALAPRFKIFPNPAKEYIHVSFGKTIEKGMITIMDVSGKILLNKVISRSSFEKLNIASLPFNAQMVLINILDGDISTTHKIMLQ